MLFPNCDTNRTLERFTTAGLCCAVLLGMSQRGLAQNGNGLVFTPGILKMEVFDLSDRDIQDLSLNPLLTHPTFPDLPSETYYIRSFDNKYAYPDRTHDQYGTRIRGVFVPPVSGDYIFYLRSDDASELWFNPGGSSESGKIRIIEQTGCCNLFGEKPSTSFPLVANERYYIEALHREGPEYDYVQVAVKRASDPTNPDFLFPISYEHLGIFAPSEGVGLPSEPAYNAIAILPAASTDPILLAEEFNTYDGGFTVSPITAQTPWTHSLESGGWYTTAQADCGSPQVTGLNSPTLTVQQPEPVFVVFRHRYSFQYSLEQNRFVAGDGGQLRMSINRGAYAAVPANHFMHNGYTGVVEGNNVLAGQEAFTGTSRGHQSGFPITTVAMLGSFNPGDTVSIQFLAAWDECVAGDYPDWEIDAVYVTHTVTEVSVDAEGTVPGVGSVPVAYTWQMDSGSGFIDMGSIEETLWLAPTLVDDQTRFRALLTVPGLSYYSEPVTLRLTREPTCAIGGPYVATCAPDRPGLAVNLDAANSADPDGGSLTYAWSADCPGAVFDDSSSPSTTLFFDPQMGPRAQCRVSLTLTNSVGASVTCTTDVDTSISTIRPTITLNGGNQTFTCSSSADNQYVELGATAVDGCDRPIDVIIGPPANTRQKGTQTVTYDAVDAFGNNAEQKTRIVVVDEQPAQLVNVPGNFEIECSAPGGVPQSDSVMAAFLSTPQAVDDCDPDEYVVNDAPSLLPLGTTLVTWTLWDDGPTNQTGSAIVTVEDTLAPTLDCAPLEIEADAEGNAIVPDFRTLLNATDACTATADLVVAQTPAPGTVLGLGRYDVTFTATDRAAAPQTTTCTTTLDVTAVGADEPVVPGCGGGAACGGNAALSLTVIGLGIMCLKLLFVGKRRR